MKDTTGAQDQTTSPSSSNDTQLIAVGAASPERGAQGEQLQSSSLSGIDTASIDALIASEIVSRTKVMKCAFEARLDAVQRDVEGHIGASAFPSFRALILDTVNENIAEQTQKASGNSTDSSEVCEKLRLIDLSTKPRRSSLGKDRDSGGASKT